MERQRIEAKSARKIAQLEHQVELLKWTVRMLVDEVSRSAPAASEEAASSRAETLPAAGKRQRSAGRADRRPPPDRAPAG